MKNLILEKYNSVKCTIEFKYHINADVEKLEASLDRCIDKLVEDNYEYIDQDRKNYRVSNFYPIFKKES